MAMFFVRFDSPQYIKVLANIEKSIKYNILRPALSWLYWHWKGKTTYSKTAFSMDGKPLKEGISFVMPAKNEEYSLTPCLESLVGIADQFILIDNGSNDNTLQIMKDFKNKMEHKAEVIVLERPILNLLQMRQEGLNYVKYNFVIRGDADMVFTKEILRIKDYALKQKIPCAIYLKKLNFFGDLNHIRRLDKAYSGEYFLRSFDHTMKFIEYFGRLEHAPLPLFYKMKSWNNVAFFHIDCNKPNERLFYRTCYLDWREEVNKLKNKTETSKIPDFDTYRKHWLLHNFQTSDEKTLQYRYARLIASDCKPINDLTIEYPDPLTNQIEKEPFRFFIEYRNGKPWLRHDRNDIFLENYQPHKDDLNWVPSMEKFKSDKIRKGFSIP